MYPVLLFGNPTGGTKKKRKSRTGKNHGRSQNMAKKGKKHPKRNPLGFKTQDLKLGALIGLGAVAAKAAVNNLPIPASLQSGPGAAAATAGVGFGLSVLFEKVAALKPYADDVKKGAYAIAVYQLAAPTLLPMLAFTDAAKAHAAVQAQAQALTLAAQQQIAMASGGQPTTQTPQGGTGDAFVLSRGGITTADRAPRDTAALAGGVGDAYAAERPGFSGAPNNLRAPWSRSIYNRR